MNIGQESDVYWKHFRKNVAKPGIKYLRCQHLMQDPRNIPIASFIWLGENRRVCMCKICWKMYLGTALYNLVHPAGDVDPLIAQKCGDKFYQMETELHAEIKAEYPNAYLIEPHWKRK